MSFLSSGRRTSQNSFFIINKQQFVHDHLEKYDNLIEIFDFLSLKIDCVNGENSAKERLKRKQGRKETRRRSREGKLPKRRKKRRKKSCHLWFVAYNVDRYYMKRDTFCVKVKVFSVQ